MQSDMACEKYNITTINIRGLADEQKRLEIFKEWETKYHVVFSNETHCTDEKENKWSNETVFETAWSHKSSNAGGCAIFTKGFKVNIIFKSNNGRILIGSANVPGLGEVCLACVYAPTQDHRKDQLEFLNTLKQKLEPIDLPIILGGDINIVLSSKDKKGGAPLKFNS